MEQLPYSTLVPGEVAHTCASGMRLVSTNSPTSRSSPYIFRQIYLWYEVWRFQAIFSHIVKETLSFGTKKLKNGKIRSGEIEKYLSLSCYVKSISISWMKLSKDSWMLVISLRKKREIFRHFYSGSLLHDVIHLWRHLPPIKRKSSSFRIFWSNNVISA